MTIQETLNELNVSESQLDNCFRALDLNTVPVTIFYKVRSESDPDKTYAVRFLHGKGFTCTCPSGLIAFSNCHNQFNCCKHVRWAVTAEWVYQAELAERQAASGGAQEEAYQAEQCERAARLAHLMELGLTAELAAEALSCRLEVNGQPADDATLARIYGTKPRQQPILKGRASNDNRSFSLMR